MNSSQNSSERNSEAAEPSLEVYFTKPVLRENDLTIMNKLISEIDSTPKGERIHVSIYRFNHPRLIDALIQAKNRGVEIFVVTDSVSNAVESFQLLYQELSSCETCSFTICKKGDELMESSTSCLGAQGGINHNKYILISKNGSGQSNIVLQTSHNFKESGETKFQDLLFFANHEKIYNEYLSYWNQQAEESDSYEGQIFHHDNISGYFSPIKKLSTCPEENDGVLDECGDPYIELLDTVECSAGAKVRVAMGSAYKSRRNVFTKLKSLSDSGCDVKAIIKTADNFTLLKGILGDSLYFLSTPDNNVHAKIVLIEYTDSTSGFTQKIIGTGSHNLSKSALRNNDEALLLIKNESSLFDSYLSFWDLMYSHAQESP